jgi:hypothetical protein
VIVTDNAHSVTGPRRLVSKDDVMLRRKPRIVDVVRIGNPPVVVIATTRKRRGRRVEIIQEISAPGLPV